MTEEEENKKQVGTPGGLAPFKSAQNIDVQQRKQQHVKKNMIRNVSVQDILVWVDQHRAKEPVLLSMCAWIMLCCSDR